MPAASLRELRSLGVKILLDDFGTGYSSLSHLQRFPIDALKIDRSFVMHLGAGEDDRAIVRAIAAMASALGLEVVAEGVETAEQAAEVQALGCGWAQGYHFARPAPAAADRVADRRGTADLSRRWGWLPALAGTRGRAHLCPKEPLMAKTSQADALFDRLRANGIRKRVARDLAGALGRADNSGASKAAHRRIGDLRSLVGELEDRAKGGPAKRKAAAKKAAQTRKRKAAARSAAARKAAKTRAKKS